MDGKSFFYVNPLSVDPVACHKDERKAHVQPVRQKWFGCACCPPNLARLISSVGRYAYTSTEDTLYIHLYIGSNLKLQTPAGEVTVKVRSNFPYNGKVSIQVGGQGAASGKWTLALRIPGWCKDWKSSGVFCGRMPVWKRDTCRLPENGSRMRRWNWISPMKCRLMQANPRVRETEGQLAVTRGPVVYCLEEKDNGSNLHLLALSCDAQDPHRAFLNLRAEPVPRDSGGWAGGKNNSRMQKTVFTVKRHRLNTSRLS